jgi:hypothetical protein
VFVLFSCLILAGLVGAGMWYLSERLIQLSLYRFSIYVQLFSCIAGAYMMLDGRVMPAWLSRIIIAAIPVVLAGWSVLLPGGEGLRLSVGLAFVVAGYVVLGPLGGMTLRIVQVVGAAAVVMVIFSSWGKRLGMMPVPRSDGDYLELCRWVGQEDHTPVDAVFVVPPQEQAFRLHARRAIVVNFKGVPQLSGQIPQWRERLCEVLEMGDLRWLPRPFPQTLWAMGQRYQRLGGEHLLRVAQRYGARYIVASRRLAAEYDRRLVYVSPGGSYFLYDRNR